MTCPSCGEELPGKFPFCPFCGAALGEEERREERKVVSVLFADLVGFTARAEQLDPEDVRALLDPYHAHLREELERFGGTVEKFIGDAVMALFGAPLAHEDDPERAVRAALEIRDWVEEQGEGLQVRIAVNTGEALVTLGARPTEGEGMAAGDVVNTAARLQAAAPVNGILVGEQTYRATAQAMEYREVEPVAGKGKSEPIAAWEAVEARSRFGVDVSRRSDTPLVGRGRELELLVSTLARAREERSSQLVTLVGVPGIGKTRLVRELLEAVRDDAEFVRWRQGRSLPYGEGVTFWALSEIVKAEAGILENDTPTQADEKLRAGSRSAAPTRRRGSGSSGTCVRSQERPRKSRAAPRRASPPGAASSRSWPRRTRSSSCSRISTGLTTPSSTSSTNWSSESPAYRCSCSARPARSSSNAGPAGAAASRTRSRSRSRRSRTRRRPA